MAETNVGFDINGGILEADFAGLSPFLGSNFAVVNSYGTNQVKVGATAMTVDVTSGTSYAPGVRHNITTTTNLPIAAVTLAGAIRWDAVVKRFDWSTNTATIMKVEGTPAVGAAKVAPAGLFSTPGEKYDQVLALVKATNNSTALEIADRRIWGSKDFSVATADALPAPITGLYGTVVYVIAEDKTYRCLVVAGTPTWVPDAPATTVLTGTSVISAATGWTVLQTTGGTALPCRGIYDQDSGRVEVDLQLRRQTGTITPSSNSGNITDTAIGTLPAALCPDADVVPMPFGAQYSTGSGSANSWLGCQITLSATGVLTLVQLNYDNALVPITTGQSFRAHLTFFKRT